MNRESIRRRLRESAALLSSKARRALLLAAAGALVLVSGCQTASSSLQSVIAAPSQAVTGERVTLDGSQSSHPEGEPLSFSWSLESKPAGSAAFIGDDTEPDASLVPDLTGTYEITLVVTADGASDLATHRLEVTTGSSTNSPPTADTGPDRTVAIGQTVVLDGSASTDPDGDPLGFTWEIMSAPAGSAATITGADTADAALVPDLQGVFRVQLTVSDGLAQDTTTVELDAVPNRGPVADAGPDREVRIGSTVRLDGSASSDPDGDTLTYAWRFFLIPIGSTASLSDAASPTPSFTPDVAGAYTVELEVSDGFRTATDRVTLTAVDEPGGPQAVLYVATDGDDSNPGTSAAPLATLGRAIDLAATSSVTETIVLRAGTYDESFGHTIRKTLTIRGAGAGSTILASSDARVFELDGTGFLTLEDLSVTRAAPVAIVPSGTNLQVSKARLACVGDCIEAGILFTYSGGTLRMSDTELTGDGTGTGVSTVTAGDLYLARTTFSNFDIGIQMLSTTALVEDVSASDNRVGLQVLTADEGVTVTGGSFSSNGTGISLTAATDVDITNATLTDNADHGVKMLGSTAVLMGTDIRRSGKSGIKAERASVLTVIGGVISENGRNNPDPADFVNRAGIHLSDSSALGPNSLDAIIRDNVQDNIVFLESAEGTLTDFTVTGAGQAGVYANTTGTVAVRGGSYRDNRNGFWVSGETLLQLDAMEANANGFSGLSFGGKELTARSVQLAENGRYNLYVRNTPELLDFRETSGGAYNRLENGAATDWSVYDARPSHTGSATLMLHGTRYESGSFGFFLDSGASTCGPATSAPAEANDAVFRILNSGNCLRY